MKVYIVFFNGNPLKVFSTKDAATEWQADTIGTELEEWDVFD